MLFKQSASLNVTMGDTKSEVNSDFSEVKGRLFMIVDRKGWATYFYKDQPIQDINKILAEAGVSVRVNEDGTPFVPTGVKERAEVGAAS